MSAERSIKERKVRMGWGYRTPRAFGMERRICRGVGRAEGMGMVRAAEVGMVMGAGQRLARGWAGCHCA